jgi:predicted DsbA family dithiol-disulfide isomerase
MSELAPALVVDVVSDVVCPWCYVGKRRLEAALALRDDANTAIRWRPFQLDGTIPAEGLDRVTYMTRKFGSLDKIAGIQERLTAIGADEGIAFDFAAIKRSPNTLDAHRLIRWADSLGRQGDIVEALFRAFFVEGRDIGDRAVLADIAAEQGLDRAEAAAMLVASTDVEFVTREIDMAHQIGVQGVPFFIFAGKLAVSGAEAADVLAAAMAQATETASA